MFNQNTSIHGTIYTYLKTELYLNLGSILHKNINACVHVTYNIKFFNKSFRTGVDGILMHTDHLLMTSRAMPDVTISAVKVDPTLSFT